MFGKLKELLGRNERALEENAKKTILIVEDSEVDRTLIKEILTKQGYSLIIAENGKVGLEKTKSALPDLIILDCEMPEMGGLDMINHLKEDDQTKDIPVIFLTSVDTPQNVIDCFEADAENFLTKPVNSKVLTSEITNALNK